jgi:predicted HAD superfamily Cof-like phosphohydrolase
MEKQLLQVRAFQTAFGAPMPEKPTMLDQERAKLRQDLLEEEVDELANAEDLEGVSDAICDILYIALGTAHEYGIADRLTLMFDEVQRSNMAKLGEDGYPCYREDGKVLKPEGWTPPNLKLILNRRFHLFKDDNAEFKDVLDEITKKENERWNDIVEREVMQRLNWWDRLKAKLAASLEKGVKKNVEISFGRDNSFRRTVKIKAYNNDLEEIVEH